MGSRIGSSWSVFHGNSGKNVAIFCFDDRLLKITAGCLSRDWVESFYTVTTVGGAKAITSNARRVFQRLEFLVKDGHSIANIAIVNHVDCLAYGRSSAFGNIDEEMDFLAREVAEAKMILQPRYPDANFYTAILAPNHAGDEGILVPII